jgi:hypothetical protein
MEFSLNAMFILTEYANGMDNKRNKKLSKILKVAI